ncbi:MAG: diguanylate cyclase [Nevskia sp.]|nr:diguanylate cyclase [Nevskia sp.]
MNLLAANSYGQALAAAGAFVEPEPLLFWATLAANVLIGLCFLAIPFALFLFVRRNGGLRFKSIFVMFGLFILASGITHWMAVLQIWMPLHRLAAILLALTAAASLATAAALWPLLPQVSRFLDRRMSAEKELGQANRRLNDSLHLLQESERRFRLSFDSAPIGLAAVALDGRFIDANHALCAMLGYSESELLSRTFQDITHPDDLQTDLEHVRTLIEGRGDSYRMEKRYFHKSGYVIRAQLDVAMLRDEHGKPLHFISQIQDITSRKRVEAELRENKRKLEQGFARLMQTNHEITTLSELSGILQACQSVEEVAAPLSTFTPALFPGYSGSMYLLHASRNYLESTVRFGNPDSSEPVFSPDACWALRRGQLHWNGQDGLRCAHIRADSGNRAVVCIPIISQGDIVGIGFLQADKAGDDALQSEDRQHFEQLAGMVADRVGIAVSNIKLRQTLRLQSIRDPLTGLFNRRYLEETLPREIGLAERRGHELSMLMIDVDRFKQFNDVHGHEAGDQALRLIGGQIAKHFRDSDIACRFGGEEFAVVLPGANGSQAAAKAEELRAQVERLQLTVRDEVIGPVTISVGAAQFRPQQRAGDLIGTADRALYRAKNEGRNRVVISAES